jgi:hypothetical protein
VPEWKSVLEAFLDEGIELPHDCKLGTCLVGLGTPCTLPHSSLCTLCTVPTALGYNGIITLCTDIGDRPRQTTRCSGPVEARLTVLRSCLRVWITGLRGQAGVRRCGHDWLYDRRLSG